MSLLSNSKPIWNFALEGWGPDYHSFSMDAVVAQEGAPWLFT